MIFPDYMGDISRVELVMIAGDNKNRSFALKNRSNGEIVKNGSSRKLICLNQSNMFSLGSSNLRSVLNWLWSFAIINGSNWERVFMNRSFTLKNGKYVSLDLSNMFSLGSSDLRSIFGGNGESVFMNRGNGKKCRNLNKKRRTNPITYTPQCGFTKHRNYQGNRRMGKKPTSPLYRKPKVVKTFL